MLCIQNSNGECSGNSLVIDQNNTDSKKNEFLSSESVKMKDEDNMISLLSSKNEDEVKPLLIPDDKNELSSLDTHPKESETFCLQTPVKEDDMICPQTPSDHSSSYEYALLDDGVVDPSIVQEEQKLAKENEAKFKAEQLALERKRQREALAKEEEEIAKKREAEQKERRYKRLMHLLKNSKMYSSVLRQKIQSDGKVNLKRRRKQDLQALRENNQKWKRKKLEHDYDLNDVLDGKEIPDEAQDEENEIEEVVLPQKDYFTKTRVTSAGFKVSDEQPKLFEGGAMRDYQLQGLDWLKVLFMNGVNGILGDEMGLGKTIQVIAFICYLIEEGIEGPFLIVAPLSTISNWINEFKRFAPKVPVMLFHGNQEVRKSLIPMLRKKFSVLSKKILQVIITSYEVPLSEKKALSSIKWHYVIVDEGHRIKNHNSQLSRALREFDTIGRLLLTGTPLQNNLQELWSLLNFLLPEVFNALDVFESWFDVTALESNGAKFMEEKLNVTIVSTLQQILTPFLLRREKKDVNLGLPPKKEVLTYCPLVPLQKELYKATVDRTIDRLLKPTKAIQPGVVLDPLPKRKCVLNRKALYVFDNNPDNDPVIEAPEKEYKEKCLEYALDVVMQNPQMQLRKIVNHPYLVQFPLVPSTDGSKVLRIDEDIIKQSGKMLVLDAMLAKLKERGHKVVIFSTFVILLDILEEHAIMRGYNYRRLDGNINNDSRTDSIHEFNNDPNIFIFYISIRAGGLGINLTAADTVILFDSDWNPQVNLQAQDRCHRIGQTRPVVVYTFCTSGTIDERIIERGNAKRRLEKMIIQNGRFAGNAGNLGETKKLTLLDAQELKRLLETTNHDSVIHSNGWVFTDEELDKLLDRSDMISNDNNSGVK